jgi:hypothetical protein
MKTICLLAAFLTLSLTAGCSPSRQPLEARLFPVQIDDRYGYIDQQGELVIPARFDYADAFSEGLAVIRLTDRFGYIDPRGHVVIEPAFDWADGFRDGLARVRVQELWGYIDTSGRFVWALRK